MPLDPGPENSRGGDHNGICSRSSQELFLIILPGCKGGGRVGWQGARRTQDRPLLRRATPPDDLPAAQSGMERVHPIGASPGYQEIVYPKMASRTKARSTGVSRFKGREESAGPGRCGRKHLDEATAIDFQDGTGHPQDGTCHLFG
jgi:hypothetical protein